MRIRGLTYSLTDYNREMTDKAPSVRVAVGKFNPPHLGHVHLLAEAAVRVDHVYALLADRADQTLPAALRAEWLSDALPDNATVLVTPDDIPAANEPWARRALQVLPERPTTAFTSERWGPGWASAMGATHVSIDPDRRAVPISASRIRADLRSEFDWLVPATKAGLARRVVLAGAESVGKTTLAAALAEHFATVLVPEYGRAYWEGTRYRGRESWSRDEFRRIAKTHHEIEADLARMASAGLVVLDTDALVTAVWHRRYMGSDDAELLDFAAEHRPDLYLVCAPDFDWVQDGTRESRSVRLAMHESTLEVVADTGVAFEVLHGPHSDRVTRAVELLDNLTSFDPLT